MELLVLAMAILVAANIAGWRMLIGHTKSVSSMISEANQRLNSTESINATAERANEILKDMDTMKLAADRANAVVKTLEWKVATVLKVCDLIENKHQWLLDTLMQRTTGVVDYVSDEALHQVVNMSMNRLERMIPELLMTKVGKYGMEFTVINTLEGAEVEINITLNNVPYEKMRLALVKGLARIPFQGKPKEEALAQQWVERAFGSESDFQDWWNALSHSILDYQLRGNLVVASKSGIARPLKVVK